MVFFENRPADNLLLLHWSRRAVKELCPKEDAERDLAANLVRRCGFDELDELEGLGLAVAVAAVDLA